MIKLTLEKEEMLHIQLSLEDRFDRLKAMEKKSMVSLKCSKKHISGLYRKLFGYGITKNMKGRTW